LQLLTSHSVTVAWNTDVSSACSLTIRALDGPAATIAGDTGTMCAIAVDGLVPVGRYAYVPNADGVPLGTESVFHADDPSAPFTMLVFGDSGVPGPGQTAVRDRMLATPADVIVHTGDMIYPDGAASDFDPAFFAPYADLIRQLVLWPCLGNHDFAAAAGQPGRRSGSGHGLHHDGRRGEEPLPVRPAQPLHGARGVGAPLRAHCGRRRLADRGDDRRRRDRGGLDDAGQGPREHHLDDHDEQHDHHDDRRFDHDLHDAPAPSRR